MSMALANVIPVLADTTTTAISPVFSLIGFIIEIAIIYFAVRIAQQKGRSAVLWGILAFFFSIIALIIVAVLPPARG